MKSDLRGLGEVCHLCNNDAKRMWNGRWYCRHHWHIVADVTDELEHIEGQLEDRSRE